MEYSQLLGQFAISLRELITAQLAGDMEGVNQNLEQIYANIQERASYLEAMNPYWRQTEYENLLTTYTQYILEEANALSMGDYSRDIQIYDQMNAHTNRMGDVFAEGVYDYITSGFGVSSPPGTEGVQCINFDQMNAIYGIRMFWFELVIWIRNYMLSRYMGLGDTEEVYNRLLQVPVDYVNILRQIFGEIVVGEYVTLFYNYIDLIDQSTSFLMGDYGRNINIFSTLLDQAESTSNYFAEGLFDYLYQQQTLRFR